MSLKVFTSYATSGANVSSSASSMFPTGRLSVISMASLAGRREGQSVAAWAPPAESVVPAFEEVARQYKAQDRPPTVRSLAQTQRLRTRRSGDSLGPLRGKTG